MKKISIITASFNRAESILQAINSVRFQNYPLDLIEHLVIDGASTDGTLSILKDVSAPHIRVLSEADSGVYDALNKGFSLATGDIIGVMHTDDFYPDNNIFSDVGEAFKDPSVNIVYGDLDYVKKDNTNTIVRCWKSNYFDLKKLYRGWMPAHPTLFIRRSVLSAGFFNTKYKISADYDFMIRYILLNANNNSTNNIVYIPRVMMKMRVGGISNKSIYNIINKMLEDYAIIKKNKIGGLLTLAIKNFSKLKQLKF